MGDTTLDSQLFAPNRLVSDGSVASTAFVNSAIPTLNFKTFGAKGDGVTDEYPAFTRALSALSGGGTLYLPPGNFNFISGSLAPPSNVILQGSGIDATIIQNNGVLVSNDTTIRIYMTMTGNDPANWASQNTTYPINAPTLGAKTVTATTAADAGNFAPGGIILISGGLHGTSFWFPGWFTTIVSVNAGTGVITLAETLPFGGSQITTIQKILALPKNIIIRDMTISAGLGSAVGAFGGQGILIENVRFIPGASGPNGSSAALGIQKNSVFRNCRMEGAGPLELFVSFQSYIEGCHLYNSAILADGGCIECGILNNHVKDPMLNNSAFHGIYVPDYSARIRIIGNTIDGVVDGFEGIFTTNVPDTNRGDVIVGNTIVGVDTVSTTGILCQSGVCIGNHLVNLNTGVAPDSNAAVFIDGNTFDTVTNHYPNGGVFGSNPPWRFNSSPGVKTLPAATATPSVAGGGFYQILNGSPQTITNFLNGEVGDEIVINFEDSNTTLQQGSIQLSGSVNYNPSANSTMSFRMVTNAPLWAEVSRSSVYPTAGGFVTQATNKTTGVTLNTNTGVITMNNAALLSGATVGFTLTNSAIGGVDVMDVSILTTGATAGAYTVQVDSVQTGSCKIWLTNRSGGSLSEAVQLTFAVIKWVNR